MDTANPVEEDGVMSEHDSVAALQAENARLIALLEAHGIDWRAAPDSEPPASESVDSVTATLSPREKVALFRRLFRGRSDVYPVRWESRSTGKSGYSPACGNEWRPGICQKPQIKCRNCNHRQLLPLTDAVIYDHLAGHHTIGLYPLMEDDSCYLLAVDFDEAEWREDIRAFAQSCRELGVPVALEISRSGQGAHAWIFFSGKVPAKEARRLGTALISHTCARTRQLTLSSYDRLFPNQDAMPKGGFGNLIALPLQKQPRLGGHSVFVNDELEPYPDQWAFLADVVPMDPRDIESAIHQATGEGHPLDVTFIEEEDLASPWKRRSSPPKVSAGPMPTTLTVTLADLIYFEKTELPSQLANRLIRLAAFQNPEFYKAQAMRLSVWNKPRVIGCAVNYPQHIGLPRGCFEAVQRLLEEHDIESEIRDERCPGQPLDVNFLGTLRQDQKSAVDAMCRYDNGILYAPTAFGKTVTAAAMIARRGVNVLVLVHRTELLTQWQEQLIAFLEGGKESIGAIGGGTCRPTGKIDIAVMQSLYRQGEVDPVVENYGHVIVDECHHIGAVSFDAILRRVQARFVLGLTATPIRRDGQQPIIFMQCGPVRHTADLPVTAPKELRVVPRWLETPIDVPDESGIQEVFRFLAHDNARTALIAKDAASAYHEGRKVLVLTERTDHLEALKLALNEKDEAPFVLHGRMSKKQRRALVSKLSSLPADSPRILLATGRLVGEGFDHPPLDTLLLAMPVSWKGTLQQYAGRLHREHTEKNNVCIYDYVDQYHRGLMRMWEKRLRGYRGMGYQVTDQNKANRLL